MSKKYEQAEYTLLKYQYESVLDIIMDLPEGKRDQVIERIIEMNDIELSWGMAMALDIMVNKGIIEKDKADKLFNEDLKCDEILDGLPTVLYNMHQERKSITNYGDLGLNEKHNRFIDKDKTIKLYLVSERED